MSRPVKTNSQVIGGHSKRLGDRISRLLQQIDPAENVGVIGLERWQKLLQASTNEAVEVFTRRRHGNVFTREVRLCSLPRAPPPQMAYHCAAQHAPQPDSNAFLLTQARCVPNDAQVKLLHHIVGIGMASQLSEQKAGKLAMDIAQDPYDGRVQLS